MAAYLYPAGGNSARQSILRQGSGAGSWVLWAEGAYLGASLVKADGSTYSVRAPAALNTGHAVSLEVNLLSTTALLALYVDGAQASEVIEGSATGSAPASGLNAPVQVGVWAQGAGFNGTLRGWRYYSRQLTAAERAEAALDTRAQLWSNLLLTGTRSPLLGERPTGVNEFDLMQDGTRYLLAYDDRTQTVIRAAPTLEGLTEGTQLATVPVRYPCLMRDPTSGVWHLWGSVGTTMLHATAPVPEGPWTTPVAVNGLASHADPDITRAPDGTWIMACKLLSAAANYPARIFTASSLDGPWTFITTPLDFVTGQAWYAQEQADPSVEWISGQPVLLFAGWNGAEQSLGAAPLNPANWQATGPAVQFQRPYETWQHKNGRPKIFNPVVFGRHLYFSHNVSTGGLEGPAEPAGWGRIALDGTVALQPIGAWHPESQSTGAGLEVTTVVDRVGTANATVPAGRTGPLMATGPRRVQFGPLQGGGVRGLSHADPGGTALTIAARLTLNSTGGTQIIFEAGTNANEAPGRLLLYVGDGTLYAGLTVTANTAYNDANIPIAAGTHDVVLDIDTARGADAVRLYLNGTLATTRVGTASAAGLTMPADPLYVGHRAGGTLPLNGDLRAWRRYGRSLGSAERAAAVASLA
ncbi:LamG-like jellyroll fold domain-containing protein [Deinococcus multiflagellatus]|uniref:LamG-like jellyroll fold domain-containing protein n=1 Tax=Deinococcus multiflagellatus TaxID=1656887 RepID=A0ABW1ZH58_9DEIO